MDVVRDKNTARRQRLPCGLKFKGHISGGVKAVMQEDVNRGKILDQPWQHVTGPPANQSPMIAQMLWYKAAGKFFSAYWWQVNAPKMPFAVSGKRLQNE